MNSYEERQQARAERYRELAEKARQQSNQAHEQSNRLADAIPFGQPILVGHHSETRHRHDIDRIHNGMMKSIELSEKAEYYENKVSGIENNNSISSDDPDAIVKLKQKLVQLETKREKFKEYNKKARQDKTEQLPSYELSNLGQNIRSVKQRIEYLERQINIQDSEEVINGVSLKINKDENRVQLVFPSIPSEMVRTKLKGNGFHWSPYNGCWQRQISDWAIQIAKDILKEV
jgi:hypothetical protein